MPTVACVLNHNSLIRSTVNVSVVSVSIKRVLQTGACAERCLVLLGVTGRLRVS